MTGLGGGYNIARHKRNPDRYGIEVYFDEKPDDAVLVALSKAEAKSKATAEAKAKALRTLLQTSVVTGG